MRPAFQDEAGIGLPPLTDRPLLRQPSAYCARALKSMLVCVAVGSVIWLAVASLPVVSDSGRMSFKEV